MKGERKAIIKLAEEGKTTRDCQRSPYFVKRHGTILRKVSGDEDSIIEKDLKVKAQTG